MREAGGEGRPRHSFSPIKPTLTSLIFIYVCVCIYIHIYMDVCVHKSIYKIYFIFDYSGSSLLHRRFSSCNELGLLFSCGSLCSTGFSLWWLLLLWNTGSRHTGFSSCSSWAQQLWCMGLAAPWQVKSSQTRNQTRVPCIGTWILNHWTTGEIPFLFHLNEAPHLA